MKMEVQVERACNNAWYQLYNISKFRGGEGGGGLPFNDKVDGKTQG